MKLYRDRFLKNTKEAIGKLHDLYVYIDGLFLRGDEARISVWEHGFMYGDSVFEGIRAYNGKVFKLIEHLVRLMESAKSIGIRVPLTIDELSEVVLKTFGINQLKEGHMRITVTRGAGIVGLDPRRVKAPSVIAMAYPFPAILGKKPVRLITSAVRRKSCDCVDPKAKASNYLDNILAKMQANTAGADDALMLDHLGFVAEATAMNVFALRKGVWSTPSPIACLEGITRNIAIQIILESGIEINERNLTLHDLYVADEVFLTGTGAEIVPVEFIDDRKIGEAVPGPGTQKVIQRFQILTEEGTLIPNLELTHKS